MARLKTPLLRKLEKVLKQRFPSPAKIKLDDHDGIIGIITSADFVAMETIDRQNLIGEILAKHLTPQERRHVQVIVAVTPQEETGYLAGVE